MLAGLRAKVRALEGDVTSWLAQSSTQADLEPLPRGAETFGHAPEAPRRLRPIVSALSLPPASPGAWTLGEAAFDANLPGGSLDRAGLIEMKPKEHGDWPATLAFAACLAMRRRLALGARGASSGPVLWCTTPHFRAEHGGLYGPGLVDLGLSPDHVIMVDAPREAEALWVLEEALRSGSVSLAVGLLKEVDLTPSRRLGLAASAGQAPALLLTLPSNPPAPSASLRLRLQRAPAGLHPLDARAPGAARLRLTLERCRGAPSLDESRSFDLEWCNVTYRFRMAADVADRAYAAPQAGERA
ncbi:MAG: hypothetical protein R3D44_07540 [Hyphomicrobiaceae bacterium]